MRRLKGKKKQQLKNVGTATALTITLVTSNVPTLVHAIELESEVNTVTSSVEKEDINQEVDVQGQEATLQEQEIDVKEQEATLQEKEIDVEERERPLQEQHVEVQEEEVAVQETDKQSRVDELDLNNWEYKEYSATIILDKYNGTDTDIVIPGEINGKQVKLGSAACFSNIKSTMTSLRFEEYNGKKVQTPTTLTEAFRDYTALESVDLSGLDTSEVDNMSYMFKDCSNLINVKFGDTFSTSKTTNMNSMFEGCSSLTSLDLSSFNTERVTGMMSLFKGCSSLTSLNLSSFNTEQVTNMSHMFRDCSNLTSIKFGDTFSTSNVTDMNSMFGGCSSLTSLNLSSFNTEQVNNMSYMFDGCNLLTSLDLSGFNTSKVTNMRFMFNSCNSLTSLNLNDFNTEQVTNMDNMFRGCSSLTSLDLMNFNTEKVTSMTNLFIGCSSLTSINFGDNFTTSQVIMMNNMFKDCSSLTNLDLSKFDTSKAVNISYMFSDSGVERLDLSSFDTSNVTNMKGMFRNTESLKDINFGDKFITSKVTDMSYMFCNSKVDNLELSGFDTSQVINMKAMFTGLDNINVLDLSSFKLDNVTENNMKYMFANNVEVEADGTIIENSSSATAKELLVVSKESKLINYDYMGDFCLPVGPTLEANGGEFENGEKVYSAFKTNVVESLDEAAIDKMINDALAVAPKPIRDGYKFISWEIKQTTTKDKTSILDKLNAVYSAKWSRNDGSSSGGTSSDGSSSGGSSSDGSSSGGSSSGGSSSSGSSSDGSSSGGSSSGGSSSGGSSSGGSSSGGSSSSGSSSGGSNLGGSSLGGSNSDESITPPEGNSGNQDEIITSPEEDTVNPDGSVVVPDIYGNQGESNETDSTVKPNGDHESPKTGDTGVVGYIGLGLTSMLGLFINNRKKKK